MEVETSLFVTRLAKAVLIRMPSTVWAMIMPKLSRFLLFQKFPTRWASCSE